MSFDRLLPLAALLAAAAVALAADRLAARRRPGGERGDFWARTLERACLILAPALLISGALETFFPRYYQTGRHLHLDLTTAFGWSYPTSYRVALALPFAVWLLLLAVALVEKPGGREAGRWLAGAAGFSNSRRWVLLCALPVAGLLAWQWDALALEAAGYPAAGWSTLAVVLLCLVAIAWSAGRAAPELAPAEVDEASPAPALEPWPQALANHGIRLQALASWPASESPRPVRGAGEVAARLGELGAREVAPELVEAVDGLLHPAPGGGPEDLARLVFAPDDCGQAECVALAATLLAERFHATTLVVTAGGSAELRERLERWAPASRRVVRIGAADEVPRDALLWVVDAEVLSDRLLPRLRDAALVNRIGLVVWWHLEAYTGVLGANLWAISRRLHRLISVQGRRDLRTLALVRRAPYSGAQMGDFVRRLLPHPFPSRTEVHVATRFPRPVELHLVESHRGHFAAGERHALPESSRHPLLVAAGVSADEGWPTHLEPSRDVTESELEALLQRPSGGTVLKERLCADAVSALARLKELPPAEILALVEGISQGGRNGPGDGVSHHVGLAPPRDPYVRHLLLRLADRESPAGFETSRRLVCAEAHPAIIRRHLLLALGELADTRRGLLRNFLWNEEVIRRTLEQISYEDKLEQREVRYLGDGDRLVIDREYRSQRPAGGERRPLDTVGARLVAVRSPAEAHEGDGVRLRVDPERLTIEAYPYRVFVAHGRRYRIQPWESPEEVLERGWVSCRQEAVYSLTWRIRHPFVYEIDALGAPSGFGRRNRLLSRVTADLRYEEEVLGAVRLAPDLTTSSEPRPETLRLARPIAQSFPTRALVLGFPEADELIALSSLCQALRHVLPVHLGIEEDALEVVPLDGIEVGGAPVFGLAIVDLYPGGIGLVDAIGDDNTLILDLFERACRWLEGCPCRSDAGCDQCLRSPAALAANSDRPPQRAATIRLLRQVV